MKFNLAAIVASTFVALSIASPAPLTPVSIVETREIATVQVSTTDLVLFVNGQALAPEVSLKCILNCAGVLLEAVCVAGAIASKNIPGLLKCISKSQVCSCAECIPGLKDFVKNNGLC
ncbi:hypothetical protein BJ875DRAFT_487274 [Amylocarpus encephaloides]|uniref:Uncharacterized protein n=1 Tax=Amylocarpus encephaloides TaxID=45428 RepID=A0A9P8C2A1_9HELO|nr:hypothetical protein BJ875DRAFT_487274 [Amylocarpus encephaloides]